VLFYSSIAGYFVYADYWKSMYQFRSDDSPHRCIFYHQQYINEMLKNLRLVLVVNSNCELGKLAWVTHFFIKEMDFFIYFDCEYVMDRITDIKLQMDNYKKFIGNVENSIKHDPGLLVSDRFATSYVGVTQYIKGFGQLPKEYIFYDDTVFHGGSRTATVTV
jgi:hypothetical protein